MTRNEFCEYVLNEFSHAWGAANMQDGAALWIPEEREGWKASYFAVTPVIIELNRSGAKVKKEFWDWCKENITKPPLCYMSNNIEDKEWWGFNTEQDMLLFILRWVK